MTTNSLSIILISVSSLIVIFAFLLILTYFLRSKILINLVAIYGILLWLILVPFALIAGLFLAMDGVGNESLFVILTGGFSALITFLLVPILCVWSICDLLDAVQQKQYSGILESAARPFVGIILAIVLQVIFQVFTA